MPKSAHFKNNESTKTHSDFVSDTIRDLLKNKTIEVNELPHVVNLNVRSISTTGQNNHQSMDINGQIIAFVHPEFCVILEMINYFSSWTFFSLVSVKDTLKVSGKTFK